MNILDKTLQKSMSYIEYRELIERLRTDDKTTGINHSESMLGYTDLNVNRMNKWDKRFEVSDKAAAKLADLPQKEIWLVLTEAWCGDAAHSLPVLEKLADTSPNVDLRLALRDENLKLMDAHLTNGGRSIPKLIRVDADTKKVLGTWGPRPMELQQDFESKRASGLDKMEINKHLQLWYARNRGEAIESDILASLEADTASA